MSESKSTLGGVTRKKHMRETDEASGETDAHEKENTQAEDAGETKESGERAVTKNAASPNAEEPEAEEPEEEKKNVSFHVPRKTHISFRSDLLVEKLSLTDALEAAIRWLVDNPEAAFDAIEEHIEEETGQEERQASSFRIPEPLHTDLRLQLLQWRSMNVQKVTAGLATWWAASPEAARKTISDHLKR